MIIWSTAILTDDRTDLPWACVASKKPLAAIFRDGWTKPEVVLSRVFLRRERDFERKTAPGSYQMPS